MGAAREHPIMRMARPPAQGPRLVRTVTPGGTGQGVPGLTRAGAYDSRGRPRTMGTRILSGLKDPGPMAAYGAAVVISGMALTMSLLLAPAFPEGPLLAALPVSGSGRAERLVRRAGSGSGGDGPGRRGH